MSTAVAGGVHGEWPSVVPCRIKARMTICTRERVYIYPCCRGVSPVGGVRVAGARLWLSRSFSRQNGLQTETRLVPWCGHICVIDEQKQKSDGWHPLVFFPFSDCGAPLTLDASWARTAATAEFTKQCVQVHCSVCATPVPWIAIG